MRHVNRCNPRGCNVLLPARGKTAETMTILQRELSDAKSEVNLFAHRGL